MNIEPSTLKPIRGLPTFVTTVWFLTLVASHTAFAAAPDCSAIAAAPSLDTLYSSGWGIDQRNTRYQPKSNIKSDNAGTLKLKWAYGLAGTTPRSYPLVTNDTIFMGDGGRGLVALDKETGCERWLFPHEGYIASAIVPGMQGKTPTLVFTDRTQGIYAVNAITGELLWHTTVDDEPVPWYTGTPIIIGSTVYQPIASTEVVLAANPLYGCCTTSGGLAALDINTGAKLWYLPTIEAEAQLTGSHWYFVQHYGPSGAPVWGAPSYDKERNWLFFGTGQNYTHPTTDTSDAIFAVDAATGKVQWVQQYTANDAYTAACNIEAMNHPNCAKPTGPDVDFGAPTLILKTKAGRKLVVAGQKSADAHAMDPATGERVWTTKLGRGGIIGGVHWGLAGNEALGLVYVPISDKEVVGFPSPGEPTPGLYALDIATGKNVWSYSRPSRCADEECTYGLSAAALASNDIVVTGSMDGYLEIFNARSGEQLFEHDAWREYDAVNGVPTAGGGFDAHGPMIADDLLMVTAGYGYVGRQRGGNAFLVFELAATSETNNE